MKIYAVENDYSPAVNITEGVKVLWDLAIHSMDFGSGFWSAEDAAPVAALGERLGFEGWEAIKAYVSKELHKQEQVAFLVEHPEACEFSRLAYNAYETVAPKHEHAFSSQGICMWNWCQEKGFQ